jgi:hypothetical protein
MPPNFSFIVCIQRKTKILHLFQEFLSVTCTRIWQHQKLTFSYELMSVDWRASVVSVWSFSCVQIRENFGWNSFWELLQHLSLELYFWLCKYIPRVSAFNRITAAFINLFIFVLVHKACQKQPGIMSFVFSSFTIFTLFFILFVSLSSPEIFLKAS